MRILKHTLRLIAVSAGSLAAQQAPPPVHLLNTPSASTKPVLGNVGAVRQLPGGKLLVNDTQKRQLLMLDPSLNTVTVIADSTSGSASSYGPAAGGLIAYYADSSLFIDPRDLSMFTIDPTGKIVRVGAVPRSQDAMMLGSNVMGNPAVDSKGHLVYRGALSMTMPKIVNGAFSMPDMPDTAAIVRVDLATRKLDTAAFFKITKTKMNVTQTEKGMSMTNEINPMQIVDDWAVMSDGTIAIVRGRDYHVDWVNAEGSTTASAKLPFEWQHLNDDEKIAVIDSAKAAMEKARAAAASAPPGGGPAMFGGGSGGAAEGMAVMTFRTSAGGGGGGEGVQRKVEGAGGAGAALGALNFINPSELPDYRPAFGIGAAKADLDGNLWIRTTSVRPGAVAAGPIYDVVNSKGELTDRVQVAAGRQVIGFGKNGVVYLVARDQSGAWIEQTRRAGVTP